MLEDTEIEVEVEDYLPTSPDSALYHGGCALNFLLLKPLLPELRALTISPFFRHFVWHSVKTQEIIVL